MLDIVVTVGLWLGLLILIIAMDVICAYKQAQREIDTSFPQPATKGESNENEN